MASTTTWHSATTTCVGAPWDVMAATRIGSSVSTSQRRPRQTTTFRSRSRAATRSRASSTIRSEMSRAATRYPRSARNTASAPVPHPTSSSAAPAGKVARSSRRLALRIQALTGFCTAVVSIVSAARLKAARAIDSSNAKLPLLFRVRRNPWSFGHGESVARLQSDFTSH